MNKSKTISLLRIISEIAAIIVFILLLMNQKLPLWIIIFGITAIFSIFLGRFYCSWICPMHTAFRVLNWIYKKLKISQFKAPKISANNVVRIGLLIFFIAGMAIINLMGLKLNMLLYITIASILVTLLFKESLWHRYLCPFGTILSFTSRKARYSLGIQEEACSACGKCQKVCPSISIITLPDKKRSNTGHECLLCGKCIEICPEAICKFNFKRHHDQKGKS